MFRFKVLLPLTALAILAGCSQTSTKPVATKEPEKPAEPVTGRYAMYQMFTAARAWAPDIQILRIRNVPVRGVPAEPGKAGAWETVFVSPSTGRAKTYTYSVVEGEGNLHKGVFAGLEESWSGPRGQTKPFLMQAIKIDSDEALKAAMAKAADYVKKNPDKPINYLAELNERFPNPVWRVIWGESLGTSNFSIYVDATTGKYLQTMH
ncbi:MAG: hypothetical protein IT160_01620 [Bryobacterales bacterium]|nr:hypothetical protein [Bryobacterales bacterium]